MNRLSNIYHYKNNYNNKSIINNYTNNQSKILQNNTIDKSINNDNNLYDIDIMLDSDF